jgi:hypothetical protein
MHVGVFVPGAVVFDERGRVGEQATAMRPPHGRQDMTGLPLPGARQGLSISRRERRVGPLSSAGRIGR